MITFEPYMLNCYRSACCICGTVRDASRFAYFNSDALAIVQSLHRTPRCPAVLTDAFALNCLLKPRKIPTMPIPRSIPPDPPQPLPLAIIHRPRFNLFYLLTRLRGALRLRA